MKKIINFFNQYGLIIISALLLILMMKECSVNKRIKKEEKKQTVLIETVINKVDSIEKSALTSKDLKIEGLKSEKRMIQSCDRNRFDLNRENQIDSEIAEIEKQSKK